MANNKRITELASLGVADGNDVLAIVDVGVSQTKNISANALFATPRPIGSSNPDTGVFSDLTTTGDLSVGGYSIDGISNDPTLTDASVLEVPTEYAVKTYVDTAVAGIVILDIIHVSSDSTAVVGNSLLVDDTTGVVNVELILEVGKEGRIDIKKATDNSNIVHLYTSSGNIDGQPTNDDLNIGYGSISFLCDGINFYII